jgi:hypothetical protein
MTKSLFFRKNWLLSATPPTCRPQLKAQKRDGAATLIPQQKIQRRVVAQAPDW